MTVLMKLLMTPTSPYARKVRVTYRELESPVEEVVVSPLEDDPVLLKVNPLGRVPALVMDGRAVFDSRVICRVLNQNADGRLVPDGSDWLSDAVMEAAAEGLLDAAVPIVMERRRPATEQSPSAVQRATQKIARCLQHIEVPESHLTLGSIGLACALGYLDFRLPEILWRDHRMDLADWYAVMAHRPSMVETMPPVGA
ncbi:MAG: glutathione S-transferase family protein [Myxococcota bacterium]